MTALARTNGGVAMAAPQNMDELWRYASLLAKSDLVPKDYKNKPENTMAAIQMGAELGLHPMQALNGIAVINGRPSVWGDLLIALVQSNPDCEDVRETFDDKTMTATCVFKRKGRSEYVGVFSQEDAKLAGLWGKGGPWTQYPKRMLKMRARAFALRDGAADWLRGLSSAEEQQDVVIADARVLPLRTRETEPQTPVDVPPAAASKADAAVNPPPAVRHKFTAKYPVKELANTFMDEADVDDLVEYMDYYKQRAIVLETELEAQRQEGDGEDRGTRKHYDAVVLTLQNAALALSAINERAALARKEAAESGTVE